MKKRILSILLALVMLVGMFPVQAFASERSYVYVSFEVCDADGSGRTLIKPERNERVQYTNDYALAAMRQAIGSNSDVKYDSDHLCITGVKDASQSDGFLDNGDIEGYRWIVLRNNAEWDGTDYNTMYKLGDNEVLRCIYTDKSVEEMSAVNKDAFVRYLSEVSESMWYESSAGYAEYMAALNVLVNSAATNADVQNATNALAAALTVSATMVEINQGEKMELGVHKSATLKATVTPSNTTDTMFWSSVDDSIVSVNATTGEITGVAEGETNVTVTVGAVSDTIKIIVKPIAATAVSIKNGEAISLEARASVQLEAELTPAGATDTVSWCVADQSIATVDENGLLTGKTVGQTTVTATAGNVSDTIKVTVTETTVPYVYFEYADGRIQELENDTFTLTALDEGSFKVGNFSSKLTWKCSDSITNNYNETEWRYWINTEGKYQPHGIKKIAATVTGNGFSKTFYINEVSSGISEIKVSVNGTEVDAQNPYSVTGMTTNVISVQGLKDGQWIYIPTQAWMAESGNTNVARILGNQMEIIDEGQSDVTVAMVDNEEAATSFSVVCNQVPVTGIEVYVPASFVIEKWDSMDGGYVGIIFGYEKPASEYYITFTPSNATNRNVIWTNLTPEIAEFHELHGAGIVPKKAGTAKFRVTSESNPDVYQDVEIVFSFKTPLTNAVIAEKSYALEEGQTVDLDITVTPDNATEPRFIWTYNKEGIVKVTETVSADTYTRTVTRRLNCLRTGSVAVTGTPIDDSANCPPIQFTVVVGDASGEDTTDYLQIAKNDIAHGKAYLSGQNQTYFNNEWTIFTYLRTGGTMDAQKKIAYLQNVQDEIANYGDSLETLDYARLILTLPLLGENPANFADEYDLVEALCNSFSDNQTSNMYAYGLLTLDSMAYEMPADSAWSRDALIEKILTFQASDGSFGLGNNSSGSVDMTAIVLQALAPYNNANHPAVQAAITKALSYLKENLSANAGFEAEGGENACSSAQVLIALTALGIDPSDKDSGFTIGKSNLITNLDGFKLESGGFYWLEGNETVNLMGTQQITYAMEAYRRFVLDLNPLYDLTDLNESSSLTFTVTLPEGEGFDAKICDGFASTVAKGGDFSFYIVIESGYERSNMVVKAGNTILTADSYGVYTIKNIKSDVQITVSGVQKLDYTNLLSAAIGADALDVAYIGLKTYKTGNGTEYQNIPFYTVKLPVESALTLTYNSTNPRAMLWMNYDNRFKENSGTYTFSSELLAGMYAMSSEKFVEVFGSDTGLNTTHTVAFIEVTTMGYNRLCCVLVELVPAESEEPEIPLVITVNGEAVEVTSLGEREYLSSSWKDPYTKPIYTVKIPAGADFVIGQTADGDGASGAVRIFTRADGMSIDGQYPYTVTVSDLKTFFNLSTEEFQERVGSDTGLDTAKNLAFIEVKDSGYERLYVLLVEFEVAAEPDEPGDDEKPDVTIPITAELHDGTALTVTVNGTQSVNGNDVPVLEIAIPEGTSYVKVIPSGDYRVYDCDGYWDENADNLSVVPSWGDFYTLTADGGRTIDYVIKFVEVKEDAPVVTVPIDVSVNGEVVEVTSIGDRTYSNAFGWGPYTLPFFTVKVPTDTEFTITAEGAVNFACYNGYSLDGSSPFTVPVDSIQNIGGSGVGFGMSAEKFVELFGSDTGLNTENKLAFIEIKDDNYDRMYGLLVELEGSVEPEEPENPEDPDITIPIIAELLDGTALTVTVNGTQSVNGIDVPVLEIAIPVGTTHVKVIPSGDYRVYDCDGYWDENADNLAVSPSWGDFYTLTADGGRTIDYVIKFAEAKEEPPVVTVPINVTVNGEAVEVTSLGEREYLSSSWQDPYTKPIYTVKLQEGADFVINQSSTGDGASGVSRTFAKANGESYSGDYPYTMRANYLNQYLLSAEEFVERVGNDTGLDTTQKLAFIEVKDSEYERIYVLLVELIPAEPGPVKYQVNLTEGAGFTLRAAAGSASPVEPGSSFSFTISINESFEKTTDFTVKANGVKLEEVDGKYTISNIQDDQTVTVEGVVGKATTDTLTVTANGERCNVVNTGLTSYKQSIYGTITDVPVYKTSVPADTDFIVNWRLDKDGDDYSSTYRYAFSIDAGGDQGAKYYPFTMRTSVFGDYMLSAAQVKEFFGLDISSANALFMEVYGSEHSEGDFNPLYGLLVELVVPKTTYTVNFALLGDHKHAETEEEIHTLIDNNLEVWVAAKDYEVEPGATILDVLNMVAAENNLTVGNPNGDYVKYITKDGIRLSEFTNGARSGWMYTINGNHSGLGVAEQKLADGDVIIFHYTDDYTREKSSPADLEAAAAVVAKINAIGTVSLESKAKIEEARAAYDELSDEQRDLISADVLKKLTDAEETYVELEKNAADKAAAEAVEDKISAIGTVTMDSKAAIDEARAAYDELSDTQKNLVSNYQLLSQAEAAYAELVKTAADEAAAKVVDDKINAIGTVTLDSEKKIVEAREAYDALTDMQKALVTNREKLFAAEKKLVELKDQDAADAVEAKIAAIGTVTLNSEAKIKAAREAYNALTDTQKALVENLAILEAAEEALELLNLAGTDITNIYKTTGDYLAGLSAPVVGSTNGEWRVIGLTRAGKTVAESYYDAVVEYVKNNIDANGRFDESKSTENARVILALTAIGKDVTNVGGYNLLKGLDDMSYIRKQGINGLLWTLIVFDSHDYEIPAGDVTREKLVQAILDAQVAGGGWALNGNVGDPDMTGMALQALSPYYGKNTAVTAAVDKALTWLSGIQNKNGSFSGNEGTTSESLAQVITGLTALGINPETDSRFIKNGVSTVDALSKFYVDGGGFKHDLTSGQNMMATEQAYYALVSYYRLLQGKTSLFDMSDVLIQTAAKDQEAANAVEVLINAIGTVTKDSGDKIKAARNAYDALTDAQKALVENYKILTAAEAKYAELVKTAEDEAAAKAVEDKIDAIGTVTLSSENKIKETRTTYDKLTAVQKALVGNYDKLTAAEQKLLELKDEAVANDVEKLINAIGTVTKDSGDKIKAARDAYDVLTENQKKLVENYKTLTDAESKFADLISTISVTFTLLGCSKHGTDQVHTLADGNLSTWIAKKTYMVTPGATVKDVLQMALTAAGMNYKNPTGNYVESINGIGEFTNGSNSGWMYTLNGVHSSLGIAEQTVKEGDVIVFHYTDDHTKEKGGTATDEDTAIENVEALINAIGTVTLNSKSKIDAARKAYDVLSFTQKQKVENYKKLTDAETKYAQLKADDDDKKANTVANLIDAIISGSSTFEKDVKAAQKAYNNLTADQKKLVDNYYKLANYLKDLADEEDKEAAKTVEALIDAIGAVTKDSEDEIKSARTAYDKLTDTQKALVNNYAELEDAEARWEDLQALVDVENIYKDTGAYLKRLGTPVPGSVGGEWMAIGLIRSGNEIKDPAAYYDAIVKFIQENIDENGRLHKAKSTENSRMILALTALGKDATAVGGYNLLAGLNDMEYVQKQGINGPIWSLIALDSGNYPAPEGDVSREALIQVILDAQLADGGWALTGSISDADITGMALQALARYYKTNADVTEAVDKAIAALSMMQAADGSFASVDGGSSESVAQVIAALSALGIDADTDTRFIKNGVSALDALCAFFVEDGGFKHIHDGKLDSMATEQSYYALVAYFRMLEGKSALFNMTDVVDMGGDQAEEEPVETQPVPTEPAESPVEEARSFPWWLVIVIGVLAGAIVVVVIISKPKKGNYVR